LFTQRYSFMNEVIKSTIEEGILIATINRPEKLNALNSEVIEALSKILITIYEDAAIKAAIIIGAGEKAFVAGADISEFLSLDAAGGRTLAEKGQNEVFDRIENCPKPIIAAVNGFALGGGCELAMACHFRIASANAKFGQPEVNLGLIPGYGGTQRLTQLIGKGRAMELMMTGNLIDATEAYRIGLVNHVTEPGQLMQKAMDILKVILSKAPLALAKVIELTNLAAKGDPDGLKKEIAAFGELFATEDLKEGASAFLEKKKPVFKGK
jgi:enoyl-CoA hydratase